MFTASLLITLTDALKGSKPLRVCMRYLSSARRCVFSLQALSDSQSGWGWGVGGGVKFRVGGAPVCIAAREQLEMSFSYIPD